jgi:pimeloyl-ACP methyl ester carboxylesterase
MPLNLAFFAPHRAQSVIQAFPGITHWAVGGHSLGGAMAARFAYQHASAVDGLVLWAAYPAENNSLADRQLAVVSIYGAQDGLATVEKVSASRPLLPSDTRWVPVEGGNHAQFGWYGPQVGDNPARITTAAQQQATVAATLQLVASLSTERE